MKNRTKISTLLAVPIALLLSSCTPPGEGEGSAQAETESQGEIAYSKSQGPYTELFEDAIVPILEEDGWTFRAEEVSELLNANIALNDGDVDLNVEQHTAYMDDFNANYDGDLVAISPIPTVPAGLYSENHDSLDDVTQGATVALPDDAANAARCYLVLEKAGWIEIDDDADLGNITADDIVENPYDLEFTEMKSLTIPSAAPDFDFYVLTGSIVYNAGIDPSAALETEDILDHLVLQVVVKEENQDADWAEAVVNAYHSDEFKTYMEENNDGLWWIPEQLQ
ncbi:MetQ/NlpA family ABC transporter substrate-binding protein [Enteractinococcus fodinae]|uniref:D-methionine transport system substrate-binding protein n=1 Tax=Enteractinococcus fodinae TaxID=684663 RepID=A0ABU2B2K8_9MICC|nr:MetQ/NlpA family ABC transporter substrate-binding protein [Enteractinococcus fodinae]MDR7347651.1 D-methionine transport system substrate-binding protein [Enteractinococcus fodinae]